MFYTYDARQAVKWRKRSRPELVSHYRIMLLMGVLPEIPF